MKKSILEFKFNYYGGFEKIRSFVGEYIRQVLSDRRPLLEVAVNEAVNNAFQHGLTGANGGFVTLKVEVLEGKRLMVRVRDQGPGFPAQTMLEKLERSYGFALEDVLLKESGRGLLIMKAAADTIAFNRKGNEVLLVKRIAHKPDLCGFANASACLQACESNFS